MKKRMFNLFMAFAMIFSLMGVMPSIGMKVEAAGTADSIISVASNEIGNGLSKYTKEMGMINNSYTYAWCAAFVSWCGAHSGSSDVISKTASCYNQYYNSSGARHWVVNDKSYKPVKGDLIYFDWNATGAKNSNFDHVGIVVSYNASTNKITTIEGNYGNNGSANNKVVKTTRDYNNKVKCFLTPKYSNPVPPTNAKLTLDKLSYSLGEKISFKFSCNNCNEMFLPVDYNGKRIEFINVTGKNTYTYTPSQAGTYGFYIVGRNSSADCSSEYYEVKVFSGNPQNAKLSIDKSSYSLGEKITFNFSCDNSGELFLPIDYNGKRIEFINVTGKNTYTYTPSQAGTYGFYIVGRNSNGDCSSEYYEVKVFSGKPANAELKIEKSDYNLGEKIRKH